MWFIDSENLCFILIFEKKTKNENVLIFTNVYFPVFEIGAAL